MKYILGTKEGMTQIFDDNGTVYPVTILRATPRVVSQVKTVEKDGYEAVQVASGDQKEHRLGKAQKGHLGEAKKYVKEFRPRLNKKESIDGLEKGTTIDVSAFEVGDKVSVTATSKGKGFQGVVKRHGFAGGPKTHGNKHHERAPGSIGTGGVQRVIKGLRMAGRMGTDTVTVKNLKILAVHPEEGTLLIKGAVPGRNGALVEVRGI